ncbi:MAG: bifunctional diguanylate cyclase/phosphodiesterase, partial [Gammaproteobacteria bacterium]|nr:bifunctional diguanylate cyclase/phosphodiesterase [Gammaproteobacteria bacterium]
LFHEIYQSARTISLLPMVRDLKGDNRTSEDENVVSEGRLSVDTHRTLQQLYTNLENNVSVSEVYYVLDGFNPEKHIPVFMYDNLIAGINEPESGVAGQGDIPLEIEEEEYAYFPQQLAWFRNNAPDYLWSHSLDQIPVRLSPLLRTCDNSQYKSTQHGQAYNSYGLIYALPVYSIDEGHFHGMITVVLRANVLEARLLGVPFLPITDKDIAQQEQEGWVMPEVSMFKLMQDDNGIVISDRRNQLFAEDNNKMLVGGRWLEKEYELTTGIVWKLKHYLTPSAIATISLPYIEYRHRIIVSRILIAVVIGGVVIWIGFNLSRSRNKLMQMAYFDNLTGLPNRTNLFDCMQYRIKRSRQENLEFSVMIINISNFGSVNQSYGHIVGDELLAEFSRRLSKVLVGSSNELLKGRPGSGFKTFVARLSGDEFAAVSTRIITEYDIAKTVQAIKQVMSNTFVLQTNIEISVNFNIGASIFPHDADNTSRLLACANTALQECRRENGINYYLFNNELRLRCDRLNQLSEDIKFALKRQQFEIMYQPKQSLVDGRMVSLEALLRWNHPELGSISPLEFIPILEHSNGIVEVGEWVLDSACRDIAILDKHGFENTCISVNVSVCQLRTDNYHLDVRRVLSVKLTDPKRIILEITESMMMDNLEESFLILNQLKSLGLSLAIDDFGTGYSSLTYLKSLPLSYLKLDKAFIDGMVNDRTFHIIKTVIQLAKGLDLQTIAEGIETVEQRDALKALGCDIIQGYLLSKPKPLSEIIDWMASHQAPDQ